MLNKDLHIAETQHCTAYWRIVIYTNIWDE